MKRKEKTKKQNKNILSGAIIVGLLASIIIYVVMLNAEKNALTAYEKDIIYVAAQDIPEGIVVEESNHTKYFTKKELDKSVIPESAITNPGQLNGLVPSYTIDEGTLITRGMFESINEITKDMENPVIAGFTVDDLYQVVGGTLRAGDRIHIYQVNEDNTSKLVWENVYVQQVFNNVGATIANTDKSSAAQRINVYLDNASIAQFYSDLAVGSLRIVKVMD